MCDTPLQGGLGCGRITEQYGVRVPIDEKYMWIQADVERDAGVPVGNKTEAGTKGQLEVEYESFKRKVDFEIEVEIWRSGLTRDSGHYIIVKKREAKGAWQAGENSEDPKPRRGEEGEPITVEEYVVVARLARFEYEKIDMKEVVQVGSQDRSEEAETSKKKQPSEGQAGVERRRESGGTSLSIKDKFILTPHGVLGTRHTETGQIEKAAKEPMREAGIAIVDPAGLPFIQNGPGGAGGASVAIYQWLGIGGWAQFPEEVRQKIQKPGEAKRYEYSGKCICIHAVGPNFQEERCEWEHAKERLAITYTNILREFIESGAKNLRCLPMSSG